MGCARNGDQDHMCISYDKSHHTDGARHLRSLVLELFHEAIGPSWETAPGTVQSGFSHACCAEPVPGPEEALGNIQRRISKLR